MKKKLYILSTGLVVILTAGFFLNLKYFQTPSPSLSPTLSPQASIELSPTPTSSPTTTPAATPIPESYLIENFPFQSQAPYANWDQLHDEACEEAALILVDYYLNHQPLDEQTMEEQIQEMVAWEIKNWGTHKDLTIRETAELARGFYGLNNFQIKDDITIEEIKKEIAQDHPVILPTAGRLLGNPYFRSPGPVYHMVVAIGYSNNIIIVQDIGTRRGENYEYSQKVLYLAIHDWAGSPENIESGSKNGLIF